jgi:hypothetical protein
LRRSAGACRARRRAPSLLQRPRIERTFLCHFWGIFCVCYCWEILCRCSRILFFSNGKWKEILNLIVRVQRTKRVSVTKTARKVLIVKRGCGIWKGIEVGNQLSVHSLLVS